MVLKTRLMQSVWFAGEIFSMHVHNTSSWPGLLLSVRQEFLERGEIFKQKFPEVAPQFLQSVPAL